MLCSSLPFAENLPDTANPTQWQIGPRVHLTHTVGPDIGTGLEGIFKVRERSSQGPWASSGPESSYLNKCLSALSLSMVWL